MTVSTTNSIFVIMSKEIRDAQRNRWFMAFALVFTGLALGLSTLGLSGVGTFGIAGFGRTVASLINLVVVIVPLMGLLLGAISISGERERGSLIGLLAQPITPVELLVGKFLGMMVSLTAAILVGYGLSGIVIAWYGGLAKISSYFALVTLTLLIGCVHLSIGFCISIASPKSTMALSLAIILWLGIVFVSDLGLIGMTLVLRLSPQILLFLTLINPAQLFKLASIEAIQGSLEILGAAGIYAEEIFGSWLSTVLIFFLIIWILIPMGISIVMFRERNI
jgi:Cu-processing system permease protein